MTTQQEFLDTMRRMLTKEATIRATGIDADQLDIWEADDEFQAKMREAQEAALDFVRSALLRRAIGFENNGRFVFSDRAAEILFSQADGERGPNRQALEVACAIHGEDNLPATLLQSTRSLADSVDRHPDNANLWRQYRDALQELQLDAQAEEKVSGVLAEILDLPNG